MKKIYNMKVILFFLSSLFFLGCGDSESISKIAYNKTETDVHLHGEKWGEFTDMFLMGNFNNRAVTIKHIESKKDSVIFKIRICDFNPGYFFFLGMDSVKTDALNDIDSYLIKVNEKFFLKPFVTFSEKQDTTTLLLMDFSLQLKDSVVCIENEKDYLILDDTIEYLGDILYKFRIVNVVDGADFLVYASPATGIKGMSYVCYKQDNNAKAIIMQFAGFIPDYELYDYQNDPTLSCSAFD